VTQNLTDAHTKQLRESGICDDCIKKEEKLGHFQSTADGLRLNYRFAKDFYRTRLDQPDQATPKKKYTQPTGAKPRLYFTQPADDPSKPIFITEGEKKALSLKCHLEDRAVCVGLGGVWNWTGGKDGDDRMLISDFNELKLNDRKIYIVFDSDLIDNKRVQDAECALSDALRLKGARVRLLTLPPEQKGIDDWLVSWGANWEGELGALCKAGKKSRGTDRFEKLYSRVYTFADMVGTEFPIPKFFCGTEEFGIVSQGGITIVHGTTNIGKTFLTTQLATCIATGEDFLQHRTASAQVLVFQGELPPGLYARGRLIPLLTGRAIPDRMRFFNWSFNLAASSRFKETFSGDSWRGFERFEEILDEQRPEVVVIDPLQSYHNIVESSNDQLRELFKKFKQVALDRNIGIVVVDHDRKGGEGGASSVRGASSKADLSDAILGLTRDDERRVLLNYDKVRYINRSLPPPSEIHMDGAWFKLGAPGGVVQDWDADADADADAGEREAKGTWQALLGNRRSAPGS